MPTPIWANPEKIGVLILDGDVSLYVDSGPEYEAAVAIGPRPYAGPLPETPPDPLAQIKSLEAERAAMAVSRFQAMASLLDAGLLSQVNTALADAGPLAQLAWAEATEFRRNSPTIAGLASGLGLTDTQVDDLFRAAALITA